MDILLAHQHVKQPGSSSSFSQAASRIDSPQKHFYITKIITN